MNEYQENLKKKMDEYAHFVYRVAKKFPREELYGIVSQIQRSALSVILNYIEGYAGRKPLVRLNFLEISNEPMVFFQHILLYNSISLIMRIAESEKQSHTTLLSEISLLPDTQNARIHPFSF